MAYFNRHPDSALYTSSQGYGGGYVAFYLYGDEFPETLTIPDTWETRVGYYLFLKEPPPENGMTTFVAAVNGALSGSEPCHTSFVWYTYNGADGSLVEIKTVSTNAVPVDDEEGEDPDEDEGEEDYEDEYTVLVTETALFNFGGYKLPIGVNMRVVYERDGGNDVTGFIFEYPEDPQPRYPAEAVVGPPDPQRNLHLTFNGDGRGCFEGIGFISDYSDDEETGWYVGLRYVLAVGCGLVPQYYPVFDFGDELRPLLEMRWDPTNHLDRNRTYLAFTGESIALVEDPPDSGVFRLEVPDSPEILPTFFRTVTGERIAFIPVTEGEGRSKLLFETRDTAPIECGGFCYYLVPAGEFELLLLDECGDPLTLASQKAEMPARFMCGLSGIESVGFMPRNECFDGDRILFVPHCDAFVPAFPINGNGGGLPDLDALRLIVEGECTAWVGFIGPNGEAREFVYYAQPEDAPLYTRPGVIAGSAPLPLMEPVAALFESVCSQTCFPVAPPAGAYPSVDAPNRPTFLSALEHQIIGPWRRDVIRRTAATAPDIMEPATSKPSGTGATPQGLIADVAVDSWTSLLLAQNQRTSTVLRFWYPDETLKAAFQTNQLFLVASLASHFTIPNPQQPTDRRFESRVNMADWKFDLKLSGNQFQRLDNPAADDFHDLNNTLIFKFSPGSISSRLRDPRSWTNPGDFNRTNDGLLDLLAQRLSAYVAYARTLASSNDPKVRARYAPFIEVIDDDEWTGIIGVNISIDMQLLPSQLSALSAGVDQNFFVAHHIVVETSYVKFSEQGQGLMPAECSLFGLVDYKRRQPAVPQGDGGNTAPAADFDFSVSDFLAVFRNGLLKEFSCAADLKINRLFGDNITGLTGNDGATNNGIRLIGQYDALSNTPSYVFTLEGGGQFQLQSAILEWVEIRKAQFSVREEAVPNRGKDMYCAFVFWGVMKFRSMGLTGDAGNLDIFSYDALAFEGMALRMKFNMDSPSDRTFTFDSRTIALDTAPAVTIPRGQSLAKKFPMRLQTFMSSDAGKLPKDLGYVAVGTQLAAQPVAAPWYGLDYTLNLGTLGEFAANAGITVQLAVTWSPGGPSQPRAQVWLKFPGVGGIGNDLFSLEGVVKFSASSYSLKAFTDDDDIGYLLTLNSMALRILGVGIPFGGGPNIYVFGPPKSPALLSPTATPSDDALGWFAVYPKPAPPGGG
ncbi:MAG: hypothetical protein JST22_16115 [Bacteroidetes bacterium]|nr:hypothetical protein [Bacteroidota bacterium]